jgi:hypothetical protein
MIKGVEKDEDGAFSRNRKAVNERLSLRIKISLPVMRAYYVVFTEPPKNSHLTTTRLLVNQTKTSIKDSAYTLNT